MELFVFVRMGGQKDDIEMRFAVTLDEAPSVKQSLLRFDARAAQTAPARDAGGRAPVRWRRRSVAGLVDDASPAAGAARPAVAGGSATLVELW